MKIALVFSMRQFIGRPLREMIDIARVADEVGIDYLCLAEHVLNHAAPDATNHTAGPIRHTPDEPWPEPLTTLAAFAAATQRIGLMTGILIAPLRPAGLLAKQAATVDALAGGKRLVLGVSTSWQEEEYRALNVPYAERGAVLNEVLGAARELWRGAPASYHGQYVNFDNMVCAPRPEHVDDIKIWFGGKLTPRLVRRVAELGHGWIPFQGYGESFAEVGQKKEILRQAMQDAGRDPDSLDVAYWMRTMNRSIEQVLDDIPAMAEAGITVGELLFSPFIETPAQAGHFLEDFGRRLETVAVH